MRRLLTVVLLAGCATTGPAPRTQVGTPVPDLLLQPLGGSGELRLASLRGKVVLLDIWASWCAPCKEEMPLLDEIAARLKSHNVEVVAVSVDKEKASAEAFLATRPTWALRLAHDPEGRVADLLQPTKMPTSYLIDAAGVVRHVNVGFERNDAVVMEARLRELAAAR